MKMKICVGLLPVLAVFFVVCSAYAATQEEVPRMSVQELKTMIDSGADVVILDTQPKELYDMGHIKGAISFPWKQKISLADVRRLPKDKLIVTYCDCGPGESDSADVASQLLLMGFGKVKVLRDPAIQGWREAKYPMEGE